MEKFTTDNTEGFTKEDLIKLNRSFDLYISALSEEDKNNKSYIDSIAERVLSNYEIKTIEQAENACKELEKFYINYIKSEIEKAGGLRRLADKINYDASNISTAINKNKFSTVRRLALRVFENK